MIRENRALKLFVYLLLIMPSLAWCGEPKIVGLIQVRNEDVFIEQCLRALAVYTDAIVVLDDASFDSTLSIVRKLQDELKIEKIIKRKSSSWQYGSERDNRNSLIRAGREIGGTHFILIDADEIFTSVCAKDNWLRNKILSLKEGQAMTFPMMNVWKSADHYRDDALCSPTLTKWKGIMCVLCDDGQCDYNDNRSAAHSGIIHINRDPSNRRCQDKVKTVKIDDINYGLIHFKCANLDNIHIKRIWYMCLEYIRANESKRDLNKNAQILNKFYNEKIFGGIFPENEATILKQIPDEWYAGYPNFDRGCYMKSFASKQNEIAEWVRQYGLNYFLPLDIWNTSWMQQLKANVNKQF